MGSAARSEALVHCDGAVAPAGTSKGRTFPGTFPPWGAPLHTTHSPSSGPLGWAGKAAAHARDRMR